jgi:hypothetical protein
MTVEQPAVKSSWVGDVARGRWGVVAQNPARLEPSTASRVSWLAPLALPATQLPVAPPHRLGDRSLNQHDTYCDAHGGNADQGSPRALAFPAQAVPSTISDPETT